MGSGRLFGDSVDTRMAGLGREAADAFGISATVYRYS